MSIPIRVSLANKNHPKFPLFKAVYMLDWKITIVDEDEAIKKQPITEEKEIKNDFQVQRNMKSIIKLPKIWSWYLDCKNTFGSNVVTINDLEYLLQCSFP